jgi:transposase-like protein
MQKVSYARHRFPPEIIQHVVWLYFRFPLSYRDVEDLLAERDIDVSYETARRWVLKFGLAYARKLRRLRPRSDGRWHLDEVFVSINGKRMYLWRAVDSEGEVPDIPVPVPEEQEGSAQTVAQVAEEAGLCAD